MARRLFALLVIVVALVVLTAGAAAAQESSTASMTTGDAVTSGLALAAFAAFCKAALGFLKVLRHREWDAVGVTVVWWVVGVGACFVFANTGWGSGIELFDLTLDKANAWELIVLGIVGPGSIGIYLNERLKAIDRTDSASQPPLFAKGARVPANGVDPDYVGAPVPTEGHEVEVGTVTIPVVAKIDTPPADPTG